MLLSELEERSRRFKLALRAGVPILVLIALILFGVFLQNGDIRLTLLNSLLMASIVFITVYFIYFLLEADASETLLDYNTNGFNHKGFEKALQKSESKTVSMLVINNLYTINENYGAIETNRMLHTITHRLDETLSENGLDKALIGRYYGAEFLIAIEEKKNELETTLEKFTNDNYLINGIDVDYEFAIITYKDYELDKTIMYLKDALVTAKKEHKKEHKKREIEDISNVSKLETDIVKALNDKSLLFTFRPLQNTDTEEIEIYEVAVKLKAGESGKILPRVYLPIVNRLGLGREYDLAIIKHLIDTIPLLDRRISFTFNISPFSLRHRDFQSKLFDYLSASDIDASRLIIELYERKAHHDLSNYFQTLSYLRTKGLRIAIDNFGSSNASMEYMKYFRFDMVQFDRDYVTKLDDKTRLEMLHSLITMSKNLNIKTVAKWVDKDAQKTKLKELGIDYVQGFGIGHPISEKELIDRYNK